MKNNTPLMALCPMGKFVFSNEDAVKYKELIQSKLKQWEVPFVDLEGVLEDGLVKDQSHVDVAVEHFRQAGVDSLFLPHCNFGTEGAVGMIASKLAVPTLLWGPRDEAPLADGTRLRDTLCGLFASSKVLHKLAVPFTYIENCRIDDDAFERGIDTFRRAVNVADALTNGIRIGLIGQRIDFFWTTIINESELLQRFKVEVLPFDMAEFIEAMKDRARRGRAGYEKEVRQLRKTWRIEGIDDDAPFVNVLAVRDQTLALAQEHGLDGIALRTFMSIINAAGAYCSYAVSAIAETLPLGHESDVHGAISDLLLRRAALGREIAYLGEFTVRHPENDNAILLWHASAPASLCHEDESPELGFHWILPSDLSGMVHFRLQDGPLTVARFDGDHGQYQLAIGEGESTPGPHTLNNYVWMEVDDWPGWEKKLIQGPFIHHVALAYGHYAEALVEACRFVPGLEPLRLNK